VSEKFDQMARSRPGPFLPKELPQFDDAKILYYFQAATIHDRGHDQYAPGSRDYYLGLIKKEVAIRKRMAVINGH
jgi:hypothetical protein